MKKVLSLFLALSALILFSCSGSNSNDPKKVAKEFYEALGKKEYDKATALATKESKTLIDLIKSMSELGNSLKITGENEEEAKIEKAVYSDAIIDGDKATVKVTVDGEENLIKLKKEDGVWKVALDKDSIKESASEKSGMDLDEVQGSMNEALNRVENLPMDSIKMAIDKANELIKGDSLKQVLEKAGEIMQKAGEAMQEAGKQ
jgi:hypothetical protein